MNDYRTMNKPRRLTLDGKRHHRERNGNVAAVSAADAIARAILRPLATGLRLRPWLWA